MSSDTSADSDRSEGLFVMTTALSGGRASSGTREREGTTELEAAGFKTSLGGGELERVEEPEGDLPPLSEEGAGGGLPRSEGA